MQTTRLSVLQLN